MSKQRQKRSKKLEATDLAKLLEQALKTGKAEGHGIRISQVRFIPPKSR